MIWLSHSCAQVKKLTNRGIFITLEGIDGTGKSTQMRLLIKHLRQRGYRVVETREPGGTRLGERVRGILLASRTGKLAPLAELALMYAARAQHLEEVVRPALARGALVVSDRFNDASLAYQGYGRQIGEATVGVLDRIICGTTQPDLTLLLDLDPGAALARAQGREVRRNSAHSRFESQGLKFHQRVRAGYLALARKQPRRVKVVSAGRSVAEVQAEIREIVDRFLNRAGKRGDRGWGFGIRKTE
jgi:dTMP kinase